MRNPALFTKGVIDFQRVARIARDKGCLFARKFAPFLPVPNVVGAAAAAVAEQNSNSNNNIATGNLSVEEWNNALHDLAKPK